MNNRSDTTNPPKRLYAAVPRAELADCLVDRGLPRTELFESRKLARRRAGETDEPPTVVTVLVREAEREGVTFRREGGAWQPSKQLAPHQLACDDRRAFRALDVKHKVSAGGLVVSSLDAPRVMLLFRRHGEATAWKTPKGGIDPGETRKQAARREVLEEAGLGRVRVAGYLGKMQYFKRRRSGRLGEKTVHLYLMVSRDGETGISPREGERFVSCEWLGFDEAIERVTQPQARRLIARAGRRLTR